MKESLAKIKTRLNEVYAGEDPSIEIYLDGDWMITYNMNKNYIKGNSIEELEMQLGIEL